jgi:hypothetical protein
MNLIDYLYRQSAWSQRTFGPGTRTAGILNHIRKEVAEIEARPDDIYEWVDVVILALEGAMRRGVRPEVLAEALQFKQDINAAREWPDASTVPGDQPIEHVK